ncbi:MAG: GNAT family N-acetyltransferase [Candidatus Kaiserbacteria bacterium]|nr:GNAT family N-acetyltransferase [Candidatus Kaiserbacteria bacterium]
MIHVREVRLDDLPVIAEMMHHALDPYYGGDHRAHAKRIVETASKGNTDTNGHFSAEQLMYVATEDSHIVGILNFVSKYQGTVKISPLIVREDARGKGVSRMLLQKLNEYAKEYQVRQIYCTVSAKNTIALSFFLAQGYVRAGIASRHYRSDIDEVMLYKIVEHDGILPEERIISIRPMEKHDEEQVRHLVLSRLSPYFNGIDDRWVTALFEGYARKSTRDPNEKYKLIWVAKAPDGTVLGVAAATPKKGEPVKLMPLVAQDIQAFSALVAELPSHLREYGHKLYTHTVPTSVEVETFQHHSWRIEAMMPEAYKCGVVTQQWGLVMEASVMRTMRVKRQYFDAILAETKPLEVRVGYGNIRKIKKGDFIRLESDRNHGIVEIVDIRTYTTFAEMLKHEKAEHIAPDCPDGALNILRGIYPREKEDLGVYVFQLKVVKKASGN